MRILVLGNAQRAGVAEEVERWLPFLSKHAEVLAVDLRQESLLPTKPGADLALVFGGDGAILRAARQMAYNQRPVLGINLGRLGFLADIHPEELQASFAQVLEGNFRTTRHLMYECSVGLPKSREAARPIYLGLNEIVIHTVPPFHMLDLEVIVDGVTVSRFSGDGLIVSTPIGSTAHNLSAGGPILGQELSAFVVTPICPHTLTYRPLVESAEREFTIRLANMTDPAVLILDGQDSIALADQEEVTVRRAPVEFQLVKVPGRGFYQTLRDKLHWGTPPSYRPDTLTP
ncbi:MAG: NAD(+)/NADH kinase [Planctomycetes bacterium]|nr:NAD(+)/NADH kinase [Planctomycetota bacterium]